MVFQYVILFNSDRELATTIHEASKKLPIFQVMVYNGSCKDILCPIRRQACPKVVGKKSNFLTKYSS